MAVKEALRLNGSSVSDDAMASYEELKARVAALKDDGLMHISAHEA